MVLGKGLVILDDCCKMLQNYTDLYSSLGTLLFCSPFRNQNQQFLCLVFQRETLPEKKNLTWLYNWYPKGQILIDPAISALGKDWNVCHLLLYKVLKPNTISKCFLFLFIRKWTLWNRLMLLDVLSTTFISTRSKSSELLC